VLLCPLLTYEGSDNKREAVTGLPVNRIATADCSQQMTRRYILRIIRGEKVVLLVWGRQVR
jgi:hypothetical protein